ncbi:hypothetical protein GY21_04745 [Cryobacterium roopkundense]|uniref:Uncharacterized protein n=1 Tax=Cryobacterium roopkundense TaxID=1001240 RepID=A0A099JND6_9MICO|nr:hypothetical protein [Cryobacterium roopkundense]KGJ79640.1 hypothetical protein GY21_04745 [Cryobacterium roopkundense]
MVQRLRPATNETTLAIIDGEAALTPGGQVDLRLEDPDFVARIVTETDAGGVVLGTAATSARFVRYIAVPVSLDGENGDRLS